MSFGKHLAAAREEFAGPVVGYVQTFGKHVATEVGHPPVANHEGYSTMRDAVRMVDWGHLVEHGTRDSIMPSLR